MSNPLWSPHSGGSRGVGITTIMKTLECPNRARLDAFCGAKTSMDTVEVWTGSLVHRLLEFYYGGNKIHMEIPSEFASAELHQAHNKAWKIFRTYRGRYAPDEFGKPLEIEGEYPKNEKQAKKLNAITEDFSCKLDMVVKPTMSACEKLLQSRERFHRIAVVHCEDGVNSGQDTLLVELPD